MGDGKGWNNCSRSVRFGLMIRQFSPNSQRIEKLLSEAREGAKNACRKFWGKDCDQIGIVIQFVPIALFGLL